MKSPMGTLALALLVSVACRSMDGSDTPTIEHGSLTREYVLHIPEGEHEQGTLPLLFVCHGGGGDAKRARKWGFDEVAKENGFAICYPEAIDGHWNDGRGGAKFKQHDAKIDDVGFVMALHKQLLAEHEEFDSHRVYVTGASNGGMFTQRLALEHATSFAAAATIIGSLPKPLAKDFKPDAPIPMLFMNGTEDPLVPYAGGTVTFALFPNLPRLRKQKSRGDVIATDASVALWIKSNHAKTEPTVALLPDRDKKDGAHIKVSTWPAEENGAPVVLYKVIGGGHTIPGGSQKVPKRVVGTVCGDIDGPQAIWTFLSAHRR